MPVNYAGAIVGGYTLISEIGRGGMSRVYSASRPDTDQKFAVKIVNQFTTSDSKFEQRFSREIDVVSRLKHPYILPVLSSGEETDVDGALYMVMPLLEGGTLRDHLEQHPALTPGEAQMLASQIGDALDYAHAQGVIHRDVKPHNIMILGDGALCLADFGIAALASSSQTVTNLTTTGSTLGTFAYMSPEQITGGEIDGRTDLYSLGVVLYQGLIGRLPFAGENTASLLSQQLHALPVSPHLVNPDFPSAVEAVLDRALAKRPADRYQTGADLAAALGQAFARLPVGAAAYPLVTPEQVSASGALTNQPMQSETPAPTPPASRKKRILIGVALLAALILLCGVIVLPLQTQLAQAQGEAAALGSRTPVIITQMVTNSVGQMVRLQVTTTPLSFNPFRLLPANTPQPTDAPAKDKSNKGGGSSTGGTTAGNTGGSTGGSTGGGNTGGGGPGTGGGPGSNTGGGGPGTSTGGGKNSGGTKGKP